MATSPNSQPEHPSTYMVQDRSSEEELARLQIQGQLLTASMGGVLPEQSDPQRFRHVLDVGCGTGDWLIEVAQTYPDISLLIGVDVSGKMLDYAREQAKAKGVSERVEFHVMDALLMLEFPGDFFDLINQRFAVSWLRTWDWTKLLSEYVRVARPDGVIRITEPIFTDPGFPKLTRLNGLIRQTFYQSGHLFANEEGGISGELASLLTRHGLVSVQTRAYMSKYHVGTPEWQSFFEDIQITMRTLLPFLQKWIRVPDDYNELCQQVLQEMQQPDFVMSWNFLTVCGTVPREKGEEQVMPERR